MKTSMGCIILEQKFFQMAISLIIIISIFTVISQHAESSSGNTHVILFPKDFTREYTAGQTVHLEGQIMQAIHLPQTGIANVHYQIFVVNGTGNPIQEGNTDDQGLFFIDWVAISPSPKISKVDLVAEFSGGGGYDASQSPPLTLTILPPVSPTPSPVIPTPSIVYHDTQLTVQVRASSSPGYVQVNPILNVDSGYPLNTSQVSISVDGNKVSTVSSNQWSGDIFVGSGTHEIQGSVPQTMDTNNHSIIYKSSIYAIYYTISRSQITPSGNNLPTTNPPLISSQSSSSVNAPQSNPEFSSLVIIAIAIIAIGVIIGLVKRKKRVNPPPLPPNPSHTDETQFYGCPKCGREPLIKYGKQYCDNCRMYL